MVAMTNIPGSKHFKWFRGTKKECAAWLLARREICELDHGALWYNSYSPAVIISDREARRLKYRDGSRVCKWEE